MNQVVKKSLVMAALVAAFAVAQTGNAMAQLGVGEAAAILNLDTGEVTLFLGPDLQVLGLEAGGANIFDVTAFDATTGLGTAQQLDADGIGFLSLSPLPAGEFNLGAILLPSFRDVTALQDFTFQFGQAGLPPVTLTAAELFPSPSVPEPGSLSLFALIGLGVVAQRRR